MFRIYIYTNYFRNKVKLYKKKKKKSQTLPLILTKLTAKEIINPFPNYNKLVKISACLKNKINFNLKMFEQTD